MTNKIEATIGEYSPVSYFEKGQAELGHSEFQAEHEGKTYFFASQAQVATFRSNPSKYAPAFGRSCAFGHTIEKDFPVDPTSFKIVDGQLLLFLKNSEVDAKALWETEGDSGCMIKAKQNWKAVQHA